MKIGFDIRKYDDFGIGTYIRNVLRGIPRYPLRFSWTLFGSFSTPPPGIDIIPDRLDFERIPTHRRSPFQGHLACVQPIDLFFAPHYLTPDPGKTRFLLTVHDLIHLDPPALNQDLPRIGSMMEQMKEMLKRQYHLHLARSKFVARVHAAERILAVSQSTADHLELLLPGTCAKTVVIPNCVDSRFFETPAPAEIERFRAGHPEIDRPYFVYCGNDLCHKNLEYLLAVWKYLSNRQHPSPLLLLAGPPRIAAIEALVRRLQIQDSVRLMGRMPVEDLHVFISSAEGLLMPSLAEGFGLPVAEAMASGVAVACSDIRPHRDITGGHAVFFNPQDIRSGMTAIERFVSEGSLRAELSAAARESAARYHPSVFDRQMAAILENFS